MTSVQWVSMCEPEPPEWVKAFRRKVWAAEISFLEIESNLLYRLWMEKMILLRKAKDQSQALGKK